MREYITNLKQRFGTAKNLATFMGVSIHTVWSWTSGRNTPQGVELRLLQVLGTLALKSPVLFDTLIGKEASPRCKPIVILPPLQPLPPALKPNDRPEHGQWYVTDEMLAGTAVEMLLGKTRAQWLIEYEDDDSKAIQALSDEDYDLMKAFIGK